MVAHFGCNVCFDDLIKANVLQIGDGYRAKNEELGGNGIMFLRAGHVTDTSIDFEGVERFHDSLTNVVAPKIAQIGDAVITTKGNSTGRVTFIREGLPPFVYSPHLSYWRSLDHDQLVPRFLYYWSRSEEFGVQLRGMSVSTDMAPYLSLRDQRRLRITLPPADFQKLVADILGSLDDKIDLNRRMNATLEAMARTLFLAWFVEFEPVRAKVERRMPTSVDGKDADLFPSEFAPSTVGVIPKGWKVHQIKELTESIQYGFTQSASESRVGPHFLRITDIQGGVVNWVDVPYCATTEAEKDRYAIKPGDIFVARTGASTGENIYIVDCPDSVFASYLVRFRFKHPGIARVVGAFMRTASYFDFVASARSGSAQPNANAQVLASASMVVPPLPIAKRFHELVSPLDQMRYANDCEATNLAALRDTLLPKLMSGEVRVQP